jgi:hypothetical protein
MKLTKEELIEYTKNHLKMSSDFGSFYRIKDIKILEVTINEAFSVAYVQYKTEVYKIEGGFIPNFGKFVDGTLTIDLTELEFKRDIKINRILNPDN